MNDYVVDTSFMMDTIYQKLEPVVFRKDEYNVRWKLYNPVTPHETINLPNLRLLFQ